MTCVVRHSTDPMAPSMSGAPSEPGVQDTPVNRPSGSSENLMDRFCCSNDKKLMTKWPDLSNVSTTLQIRSMATNTKGGSSDREQKALTVRPCGVPSEARVVRTATPVGKSAQARRNRSAETAALDMEITLILS